jgi:hypothetical protein
MSSEIWPVGKFRVGVEIDYKNSVKETNETNNVWRMTFTVQPKIQLKPAKKVKIQKAKSKIIGDLVLIDYDILSVKSNPEDPHTAEYISVKVKIKNKSIKKYIDLPIYFKCKPLDGGTCPNISNSPEAPQPGEEIINERTLYRGFDPNETKEVDMFLSGKMFKIPGRYLLSAAKDKDFKQSLVSTIMTVREPEDLPLKISELFVGSIKIPPSNLPFNLLAGQRPKKIIIKGDSFNEQSKIYYQNMTTGGNIWTVADSELSYSILTGSLPVSASNVAGSYRLWVQNPNGDKTFKYQFNIVESGTPPQIYDWSPKTIANWGFTRQYNDARFTAKIAFTGKNIFENTTDFWIESNTVSDYLNTNIDAWNGHCSINFHILRKDLPIKEGEIKLWIYNKHNDPSIDTKHNAQWFIIKVRHEAATIINPPLIQKPDNKAIFTHEDIKIELIEQTNYGVSGYEVEWKKKAGNFFLPVSIMSYISRDTEFSITSTIIPANKFENNGVYLFRVRVKGELFQAFLSEDRQWSDWREFKVIRRP